MEYIEKNHNEFAAKELDFNEKIQQLDDALKSAKSQIEEIIKERDLISKELETYTEKYDEIERISQNIGKLYLVAESNASTVINNAKENSEISRQEVAKNILSVEDAHNALSNLNVEIIKTTTEFSNKLQSLILSLDQTKDNLSINNTVVRDKLDEYEALLEKMNIRK